MGGDVNINQQNLAGKYDKTFILQHTHADIKSPAILFIFDPSNLTNISRLTFL